jgi:hypothetical protein
MVLLAGTNDIAGNNGPQTLGTIKQQPDGDGRAQVHNIKVILCALTPVSDKLPGRKQSDHKPWPTSSN